MNCPNCGKEMEPGSLATECSGGLFFLPEGVNFGFFTTRKGMERKNAIVLDGPYHSTIPNETKIPAFVCRNCQKIMLDY